MVLLSVVLYLLALVCAFVFFHRMRARDELSLFWLVSFLVLILTSMFLPR